VTPALDTVIVGNGAAAAEAVLALRASGFRGRVDLFADGGLPPYNPMLGTHYVAGELARTECFPFGDRGFYAAHAVEAHLTTPVASLRPGERALVTGDGSRFSYRQCLLATGASAVVPAAPGLAGPGVLTLRSFPDAVRLRGAVVAARVAAAARSAPPRAVVLGASFAGLEVARALVRLGLDVAVVEREPAVLPRVAHPVAAAALARRLRALGVGLHLGAEVDGVVRDGGLLELELAGGRVTADFVVVCTGTRANVGLLAGSGLAADGGAVDVDERMCTAAPGLLAAGDVARTLDPVTGERTVVALWSSARRQGRAAGLTLAGVDACCPGGTPCNIQHVADTLFASGGSFAAADRVDVDERDGSVVALGFLGSRLVGFNLFGDVGRAGPLAAALGHAPCDSAASGCLSAPLALAAVREGITWKTRNAG
jgi:NADPH-dependent 2,4-dienoyl-CoA reductase/sulfur reductase-like enzyme